MAEIERPLEKVTAPGLKVADIEFIEHISLIVSNGDIWIGKRGNGGGTWAHWQIGCSDIATTGRITCARGLETQAPFAMVAKLPAISGENAKGRP